MEIERPKDGSHQTKFSRLEKHEPMAFDAAAEVTERQLTLAIGILEKVLAGDPRRSDPSVLAGTLTALATNFAAITISRAEVGE
jgi:hypothetical protein